MNKGNTSPKIDNLNGLAKLMIMPPRINLNMLKEQQIEEGETAYDELSGSNEEFEYVYEEKEVVTKKEVSIWRILSNRYLMVRRAKRLGEVKTTNYATFLVFILKSKASPFSKYSTIIS